MPKIRWKWEECEGGYRPVWVLQYWDEVAEIWIDVPYVMEDENE